MYICSLVNILKHMKIQKQTLVFIVFLQMSTYTNIQCYIKALLYYIFIILYYKYAQDNSNQFYLLDNAMLIITLNRPRVQIE